MNQPRIIIIAGPNGAGKTTFAREFLPQEAGLPVFVNADLIAAGLSPFAPETVALQAGRLMLQSLATHVARRDSFAFESTLSGMGYARQIPRWRAAGYRVELFFLDLPSEEMAVERVAERVRQGGHNIPEAVIRRRFRAGRRLFKTVYRTLVDRWVLYDNSGEQPLFLDSGGDMDTPGRAGEPQPAYGDQMPRLDTELEGSFRAMRRAARRARAIAIQTGTRLIVMRNGRVVRLTPEEDTGHESATRPQVTGTLDVN